MPYILNENYVPYVELFDIITTFSILIIKTLTPKYFQMTFLNAFTFKYLAIWCRNKSMSEALFTNID